MKKYIPLSICFIFINLSCDKDKSVTPELPADRPLAETIIGPKGGNINTEDFSMTIPNGTFDQEQNLKLYLVEDQAYNTANKFTNVYKIDNIPAVFHKPIKIKIKYNKELEGNSFIVLGNEEFISEREETKIIFNLASANDSSGFLCADMLPSQFSRDSVIYFNKSKSLNQFIDQMAYIVYGIYKNSIFSSKTSEIIKYDVGLSNSNAVLLGQFIDGVVEYFQNKNLINENFFEPGKKIKIFIVDDKKSEPQIDYILPQIDKFEQISPFQLIDRFEYLISQYKINFNEVYYKTATEDDLRMIAAEAVYRLCLPLWLGSEYNWFNWSSLYWVKHEFRNDVKQWENIFSKNTVLMQPFYGMETGQNKINNGFENYLQSTYSLKVAGHGVGMSPFIKFIMDNYDSDGSLLINIFGALIKSGKYIPADAIINTLNIPEYTWWPDFFKEYIAGNIFDINGESFINKIISTDDLNFVNESDSLKIAEGTYPDLSAKLYKINLSQLLKDKGKLMFKLGPSSLNLDYIKALVFGLKNDKLVLVNEGIDFTVSNLQENDFLIACVVNCGNEPPYTGTSNIDLEVRSNLRSWDWPYINVVVRDIEADVEVFHPYYNTYDTIKAWGLTFAHQPFEVTKEGNEFKGIKDKIYDWGSYQTHEIGEIKILTDETNYNVLNVELIDSSLYNDNVDNWKLTANSIPFYWKSETSLQQQLEANVRTHITKLEWFKVENLGLSNEIRYKLLQIVDDKNATIEIYWSSTLP